MLTGLIGAMLVIAIVGVIVYAITALVPMPAPFKNVIYILGGLFCLLYLLSALGVAVPLVRLR